MHDRGEQLEEVAGLLRDRLVGTAGEDARPAPERIAELVEREAALLSEGERDELRRRVAQRAFGLGPLEPLLADPAVDEVMVNGPGRVWVERAGRIEPTAVAFGSVEELRHAIERILAPLGRRVDEAAPLCDARLPDGIVAACTSMSNRPARVVFVSNSLAAVRPSNSEESVRFEEAESPLQFAAMGEESHGPEDRDNRKCYDGNDDDHGPNHQACPWSRTKHLVVSLRRMVPPRVHRSPSTVDAERTDTAAHSWSRTKPTKLEPVKTAESPGVATLRKAAPRVPFDHWEVVLERQN